MVLLLHTLIEGIAGLLFLFYPGTPELVPGFGSATGDSYGLLLKMYGLAALFLAALSLLAYLRRSVREVYLLVTASLSAFHFGMAIIQAFYNPDSRGMLLHFLLAIFLAARYVARRREGWASTGNYDASLN